MSDVNPKSKCAESPVGEERREASEGADGSASTHTTWAELGQAAVSALGKLARLLTEGLAPCEIRLRKDSCSKYWVLPALFHPGAQSRALTGILASGLPLGSTSNQPHPSVLSQGSLHLHALPV